MTFFEWNILLQKKMKLKGMSHETIVLFLHELILKVNGVVTFISGFVCVCV